MLRAACALLPAIVLSCIASAQQAATSATDDWPDLAELGRIQVTTVSRRPVSLAHATAAISVLTADDIARSGARSVAEVLREVPGLMVGQIDANSWAISSRGFNSEYGNKMLVMMDGRSVYSPVLSLTYWDTLNPMLNDLDRIEVIRGPGATHWGANAVNGVINIVTKDARDTQGALVYGDGGWPQSVSAGARYGGQAGPGTYYRVYGLYQENGALPLRATGEDGLDGWYVAQGGFRLDYEGADGSQWTWQGDAYSTETPDEDETAHGANTLGRFKHSLSDTSALELQIYYDYTWRRSFLFENAHHTLDLDFQHSLSAGPRNNLIWGLGYRLGFSRYAAVSPIFTTYRSTLTTRLFSTFVEDEIVLVPKRLTLTPGCKIEHNDMTGCEPQPGLRISVTPTPHHSFWAAVSRAVRTPSEVESFQSMSYPLRNGLYLPDSTVDAERLVAYEAGGRLQAGSRFSMSLATYLNTYDRLISIAPNGETLPSGLARLTPQNLIRGRIYGTELTLDYLVTKRWRLAAWYALCLSDLDAAPGSEADAQRTEDSIPTHQAFVRSSLDLAHGWKCDVQLRFVDRVDIVPSYIEADARLAWKIGDGLELALVGQNLLHDKHPEYRKAATYAHTAIPRSFFVKLTWKR
jgi:iron complex outermembrane receptor protein